ncbi:acyl-CoA synthetase [Ideonella sp. DXS29W]|uniref:Acyl-CoA synthetase n=1 Tax=Ideonella lacteola TaxID=2984193 RepID=A0ABU9BRH8_9BURK
MSGADTSSSDWSQTRERSNALALRIISWVAVHGGRRAARVLLWPITAYFLLFAASARRHSARYLARALGRAPTWRDQWRHFHTFASTVLDRVYFLREASDCFDLTITGTPELKRALEAGHGAFLVGGHLGSFEALAAAGRSQGCSNIAMVMYPDNARMINAALQAIAPQFEMRIIPLGQRGTTLAIRDWLDEGGLVGLLADRTLPGAGQRDTVHRLPFLGRSAPFADGPFRLAQVLRRPVFFMAGLYNGGRAYDVRFELLADFSVPAVDAADRHAQVQTAVEAYAARLEALCAEAPYNWFNFHDFWLEDGHAVGGRDAGVGAGGAGDRAGRSDGAIGSHHVG